ncbi:MAG: ABC transporter substrate-binding protein [Caldimonas sp.]
MVLVSSSERLVDRLEALGLKVIVLDSHTRSDERRSLSLLGRILGLPSAAEKAWSEVERQTRAAAERVPPGLRGKRVYFEVDATPYAAGAASFIGETLTQLGMGNAIPAELGPFPKLNPEYVVRVQPDIIIAISQNLADMPKRPGWSYLRALTGQQTCGFSSLRYELLVRPSPRMGEAAQMLAECSTQLRATGRSQISVAPDLTCRVWQPTVSPVSSVEMNDLRSGWSDSPGTTTPLLDMATEKLQHRKP